LPVRDIRWSVSQYRRIVHLAGTAAVVPGCLGGSWIWPLLGLLLLPFTTLMWVILWNPATGISGFDWFWLFLAVLIDLGRAASSGYANRDRYPGYSTA
jgi:hypothetical protein